MAIVNLTEARIRELPLGSGIWRDEQVKGLLVICHQNTKSYAAQGDVRQNGRHVRTVRLKIDRVDRIGLREARTRAKAIMSQIQSGVDPTAKPEETGITLKQALDAHLAEKTFRETTEESYRYTIDHHLVKFRGRAVTDITRSEVRDLFEQSGETPVPAAPCGCFAPSSTRREGSMRPSAQILATHFASLRRRSVKSRCWILKPGGRRPTCSRLSGVTCTASCCSPVRGAPRS
jgi:hypothetical protein